MSHTRFGVFDVDTRQAKKNGGWGYMPMVRPYRNQIDHLMGTLTEHRVTTIVTSCVAGNILDEPEFSTLHPDTLFIPMATDDDSWLRRVDGFDTFFVEKRRRQRGQNMDDDPKPPYQIFLNNPNANRLINRLDVEEWFVFGKAMDVCGDLVIANMLKQGCTVRYIPELMIPSSACGDCEPALFKQHFYDRWQARGVQPVPLQTVLDQASLAASV
ncbi:MAG: hypothetical protein ACK5H2_01780 [Beutenbergiaceae bacterium]